MIHPTYGADGQPDYSQMSIWILRCDRCPAETLAGDAEDWHQGRLTTDPVFCPADVQAIAKRLIDSAHPEAPDTARPGRRRAHRHRSPRPPGGLMFHEKNELSARLARVQLATGVICYLAGLLTALFITLGS